VIQSKHDRFAVGDYVLGMSGWREYWLSDGTGVGHVEAALAPIQTYLGVLGMPGMTAYMGLLKVGEAKAGETVFVSAASGSVGSLVCQLAKIQGCRVVGSAGSDEKVAWLKDELGADAAFNYKKSDNLIKQLAAECPEGIDVYFDNVGGDHLEAALWNMKDFGRVVVCGMISQYNATEPVPGPSSIIAVIPKRLKIQGFIVTDFAKQRTEFLSDMANWLGQGRIRWRETVVEGLENAPQAFIGLFSGDNVGKMLVRVGPDPAV
jgi:hypothetical protein